LNGKAAREETSWKGEMPVHRLCVCRTCPRDSSDKSVLPDQLRTLLAASALAADFRIDAMECLGGCPAPCAVALDAPAKWRVLLARLIPEHGAAVLTAAVAYLASPDGYLTDDDLPPALRGHITARSPKRPGLRGAA
jgi:predicted metal-binding protein